MKIEVYYRKTNGYNDIVFINTQDNNYKVYDEGDFKRNEGFELYASDDDEEEKLIRKLKKWVKITEFDTYYDMLSGSDIYDDIENLEEDCKLIKIGEYEERRF